MSKHALESMSDTLRLELGSSVQVSLIEMGAVATPMSENAAKQFEATPSPLYADTFRKMAKALSQQSKNAIPPELATKAIIHALTAKKAKPRYVLDAATFGLFMMRKFAPDEIADKILLWSLGLKGVK